MLKREKRTIDMCSGPLLGNIIRYTIPLMLTGVLQLLFNAADLVVVGQFCGSLSVAAVGATSSLVHLIVNLFMGVSVGAGVTVAHTIGAGKREDIHRTVHTAIPLALLLGAMVTVLGVVLAPPLLHMMDTPDNVIGLSTLYVRVYFAGMIPFMLYNFGAAILRAAGDSKSPLYFLTLSGVLNVGLNVLFVTALDMDVAGVALATAISQAASAVLVLWALRRRCDACRLEWKSLRIHRQPLLQMLRMGIPTGLQSSMFSVSNVLIQSSINAFGEAAVAGNAAAGNLEGFVYMAMNAFSQSAMNFTGQNMGAGNYKRVRRVLSTCLVSVSVAGLVLGVATYLFGEPLLGLYITDSPEAVRFGMLRLMYICVPYFLCGVQEVSTNTLRGMGSSVPPMIISVVCVCGIRVLWIYTVFARIGTLGSLYLSYAVTWVLVVVAALILYAYLMRRLRPYEKVPA